MLFPCWSCNVVRYNNQIVSSTAVELVSEACRSGPTTSARPSTSSTTDVPLIAEPPSSFSFNSDLTSHSRRSSVDITATPEQSFVDILSPTLEPLQADNSLRGSRTSLSSTNLQQATRADTQQQKNNTLQGLIASHGITAYNSIPGATSQGITMTQSQMPLPPQRQLLQGMTNNPTTAANSAVPIQEAISTTSLLFSRHQDHSLPLNFVQSQGHQTNIGNFSLPPLALPSHLQSEHSLAFESPAQSLNGLLGDSSNQPRNLQVLNPSQKNSLPSVTHCEPSVSSLPGLISQMPVSLPHPIMAASGNLPSGLPNPSSLPIFPGMPNMYSYPYPTSLSSLSSQTTSTNMPPFPSQGLVSRYPAPYITPPLYGNSQPPIMNRR